MIVVWFKCAILEMSFETNFDGYKLLQKQSSHVRSLQDLVLPGMILYVHEGHPDQFMFTVEVIVKHSKDSNAKQPWESFFFTEELPENLFYVIAHYQPLQQK